MKLEAIATKLAGEGLGLVQAQNLFVHHMPADTTPGVMLRFYFGGTDIDPELPGYRKTSFQMIVRDSDYARGMALANSISTALNSDTTASAFTIPGITQVNYIRPRSEPFVYPLSAGSQWEFLVTFDACYVA